jgi:hypothetical protein
MKIILALILAVMLALTASAVTETVQFSPYKATFDLNTTDKYTITAKDPTLGKDVQMEPGKWNRLDVYSFDVVKDDRSRAQISVSSWKNYSDATLFTEVNAEKLSLRSAGIRNVSGTFVDLGGKVGYVIMAKLDKPLYVGWYWLDKLDVPNSVVSYGKQKVSIVSNLTNEESASLLSTIKVQKS